jgi:hypothetical protein
MSDAIGVKNASRVRFDDGARRMRQHGGGNDRGVRSYIVPFGLFIVFIAILGLILFTDFDYVSHHPEDTTQTNMGNMNIYQEYDGSALSKFPTIKYALEHSDIVGIYFAASWCPMSTPVTNKLDFLFSSPSSPLQSRVFSPSLIEPHDSTSNNERKEFSIVYVSSDDNKEDMDSYTRKNWITVPFDTEEKTHIKRHFGICAQIEMEPLGISRRKQEIPSLLIIDSQTNGLLSAHGANDIIEYGERALDHWIQLRDLVRSLSEKYSSDGEDI